MKQTQKKFLFLTLFTLVGFGLLQIPFNKLAGSNVSFTLFDFFAPIAGAFLGPIYGVISVLGVEVANNLMKQTPWTTGSVIRLFPTLFAVIYFATISKRNNGKWILVVPFIAIFAFLAHPIGRQVPYYTLFWIIPFIAYRFIGSSHARTNLYMRSLGATFTAHSVGGMMWIWALNLPAKVWIGLIPVVIEERLLFAAGIAVSFVLTKKVLTYLVKVHVLPEINLSQS